MIHKHRIAIKEVMTRFDYMSSRWSMNRRAGGGSDIQTAVRLAGLAIEVAPQPKRAAELTPGRQPERFFQGAALTPLRQRCFGAGTLAFNTL